MLFVFEFLFHFLFHVTPITQSHLCGAESCNTGRVNQQANLLGEEALRRRS